jgi:hypothetical protein
MCSTSKREKLPKDGKVKRYLLTSAQNNTKLNDAVWDGLQAFADHIGAQILISRFTYNKQAYENEALAKIGTQTVSDLDEVWYDPRIAPFQSDERIELAPGLMWCGEANIIPTAARPLSGFESYTGRAFRHLPAYQDRDAKHRDDEGQRRRSSTTPPARSRCATTFSARLDLKAEFHHSYGALLVEVDENGQWWCRQINVDSDGTFYDWDLRAQNGRVTKGHRVEAITWGDVHVAQIDEDVRALAWGKGGMLDVLRPKFQFLHDVLDMRARNHHDRRDPHKMFAKHVRGQDSVGTELRDVVAFLCESSRPWAQSIIVDSNHHDHLTRLAEGKRLA